MDLWWLSKKSESLSACRYHRKGRFFFFQLKVILGLILGHIKTPFISALS